MSLRGPSTSATPGEFAILQLAEQIIALTANKSRISYLPLPANGPNPRCADIRLAIKELRWEPRTALADGLKQTTDYFARQLAATSPAILAGPQ